jgi:hypothetical protein
MVRISSRVEGHIHPAAAIQWPLSLPWGMFYFLLILVVIIQIILSIVTFQGGSMAEGMF